ncbi:hypothetical protein [Enterobacter phage 01_vB_Eclo_IJM]|nr:hypothetical protein [Enterobacter phage 01_vB_Eclo_IJM]
MVTITAGMVHFQRTFLLAQLLRLLVVLVTGSGSALEMRHDEGRFQTPKVQQNTRTTNGSLA